MTPTLLIVTGAPATGKTTLARRLSGDLSLPLFTKDDIKERLYDCLGVGDRVFSQKFGIASTYLLYHIMEACLSVGKSLAIESNFHAERSSQELLTLAERYPFRPVQILCWADEGVLRARYRSRSGSQERHPGHVDHLVAGEEITTVLRGGRYKPVEIGGTLIELDTTEFAKVVYEDILGQVRAALAPAVEP